MGLHVTQTIILRPVTKNEITLENKIQVEILCQRKRKENSAVLLLVGMIV